LHATLANELKLSLIVHITLLLCWLEDDFEVCDNHCALKRWNMTQVMLTGYVVDHPVLFFTDLDLVFSEARNVLLGD